MHGRLRGRRSLLGYGFSVLATVAVTMLRACLDPWLGTEASLVPFVLSVTVSAWIGGFGPGVVATLGSALSGAYFFFEPRFTLAIEGSADRLHVLLFVVTGLCISILSERMLAALTDQMRVEAEREALLPPCQRGVRQAPSRNLCSEGGEWT